MSRRPFLLVAPLIGVFVFLTAGAASGVSQVEVSDATPAAGSAITVISTGWSAGRVVTIELSGTQHPLARVTANADGNVRARVTVPADVVLDVNVLSVVGTAASGVPQQIVAPLAVHGHRGEPAPTRPWGLIIALGAIAAALLILSGVGSKPVTRLAAS